MTCLDPEPPAWTRPRKTPPDGKERDTSMRELTDREREELARLERILLTEVPPDRFSCFERKNARMCLEPGDGCWYVYFSEHGLGEDVTVHADLEDAALQLIRNVSPTAEAEENMRRLWTDCP